MNLAMGMLHNTGIDQLRSCSQFLYVLFLLMLKSGPTSAEVRLLYHQRTAYLEAHF